MAKNMSGARAIKTELLRSFDFKGRTARADYIWYLTFSATLFGGCIAACLLFLDKYEALIGMISVTALFYVPVTSAGVRRLHDVGESGWSMLMPLVPVTLYLAIVCVLVWLATYTHYGRAFVLLGVTFFILIPFFFAILLSLGVVGIAAVIASLAYFDKNMALLLQPSQSGPNRYGPNPSEGLS